MTATEVRIGPLLAVSVVLLTGYAAGLAAAARLGTGRATVTAALRAVLQLAVVSAAIAVVLRSGRLTAGFVAVMYVVATATAAQRVAGRLRSAAATGAAIAAGVAPVLAFVLSNGLVPATGTVVVPVAGILIGGAMTATSLAGRRALDELHTRRGEYEAGLALGLSHRDAALLVCRPSARQALVPALDQTRTVGLVTLPGAFVGALLGGATPVQAGAIQLLVLVGLLAAETAAVLVIVELVAGGRVGDVRAPWSVPNRRRPARR